MSSGLGFDVGCFVVAGLWFVNRIIITVLNAFSLVM